MADRHSSSSLERPRPATHRADYGALSPAVAPRDSRDGPANESPCATALYDVQRNLLDGRPVYLEYSREDFAAILLDAVGPRLLSSDVVDALFREIEIDGYEGGGGGVDEDEDDDGHRRSVDAERIARYLRRLDMTSVGDGVGAPSYRFGLGLLSEKRSLGTFLFFCASSVSIANNLYRRSHGACTLSTAASFVAVWLSLVGSGAFVWEVLRRVALREGGFLVPARRNLTLPQIVNLFWLLGSSSYVVAVHGSELRLFPESVSPKLWIIGGASYFIGGLLSVSHIYSETLGRHKKSEEMMREISSFMESTGVPLPATGIPHYVEDGDITSAISLEKKQLNMEPVFQDMEQESSTLDTELMTQITGSLILEPIIGRDIMSLDGSDSSATGRIFHINYQELFHYLKGPVNISVLIDVVQFIFMDGRNPVVRLNTETWWPSSHAEAIKKLIQLPSFYISVMYAVAGGLFTLGACEDETPGSKAVQNMFLVASFLYLCGSTHSLYQSWKTANSKRLLLHSCRMALRRKAIQRASL